MERSYLLELLEGKGPEVQPEQLLCDAEAKLDRAGEHLKTFMKEARLFREKDSHTVTADTNKYSRAYVLQVVPKKVPPRLGAIAGDVLNNLRPTLDYLVYALAYLDSGGKPQDGTQFPICDKASFFKEKKSVWLKGLSPEHVAAIEGLQPYDGRKEQIWLRWLRDLSNPDKHRHLSVMATEVGGGFEVLDKPKPLRKAKRIKGGEGQILPLANIADLATKLAERPEAEAESKRITFSIPRGHKLAGADVYVQVGLRFDIAFDDGLPVASALDLFHARIAGLLETFKPEFQVA
jgi:hypothetical protein